MKNTYKLKYILSPLLIISFLNANKDDPSIPGAPTPPSTPVAAPPTSTSSPLPPIKRITSLSHLAHIVTEKPPHPESPSAGSLTGSSSSGASTPSSSSSSRRIVYLKPIAHPSSAATREKIMEYRMIIASIKSHSSYMESLIYWQHLFMEFLDKTGLKKIFDGLRTVMKRRKETSENIDFIASAHTIFERYQARLSPQNYFEGIQILKGLDYSCTTIPEIFLNFEKLKNEVIKNYEIEITALTRIVDSTTMPIQKTSPLKREK